MDIVIIAFCQGVHFNCGSSTLLVGLEAFPPLLLAVKAGLCAYMIPFNRNVNKVNLTLHLEGPCTGF
jgi:hypothetical protein